MAVSKLSTSATVQSRALRASLVGLVGWLVVTTRWSSIGVTSKPAKFLSDRLGWAANSMLMVVRCKLGWYNGLLHELLLWLFPPAAFGWTGLACYPSICHVFDGFLLGQCSPPQGGGPGHILFAQHWSEWRWGKPASFGQREGVRVQRCPLFWGLWNWH